MKTEKKCAIMCYIAAVCFYVAAAFNLFTRSNTSMGIMWLCLGSAMLCFGGTWLNKINKDDK